MIQSDTLSQRPDHIIDDTKNDNLILLPDNIFVRVVNLDLRDALVKGTTDDSLFARALEGLKEHAPFPITSQLNDWRLDDGLYFSRTDVMSPCQLSLP